MGKKLTDRGRVMLDLLRRQEAGEELESLAKEADVTPSTLVWWCSQLRDHLRPRRVEFIEVKVAGTAMAPPIILRLREAEIELRGSFDANELARVISVLRSC